LRYVALPVRVKVAHRKRNVCRKAVPAGVIGRLARKRRKKAAHAGGAPMFYPQAVFVCL